MDASLCNAAQTGNIKELYRLIQRNGNILRKIDEVEFIDSPLHIAAAAGCVDFAMEIMSLKPSFARKMNQDGLSPMHLAVMKGHTEMALRFLEIDGDLVRVRGKKGKTPLYHICKRGNSNGLLEKFLEACPESIRDVTTKNQTALHIAVQKNNLDVVKVLVQALNNIEYRREVVNRKDQDGNTALHIAASKKLPQIVLLLLLSSHMDASLCSAAQTGNIKELYRLIQRNGNILRKIDEVEFIDSPLHIAAVAGAGCIGFAMEIMSLKPSFARKLNQDGLSPMHLAVMKGHTEMALRFLKIDGGLVRVKGKKGKTPLHHICKQGNPKDLLEKFLKACPESTQDVTTKNKTALHIAVEKSNLDVVKVLVQALRKIDHQEVVNRKDEDGNTALHIAARNNQPQILKLLLTCKADKHATNHAGLTAMNVAELLRYGKCTGVLLGSFIPGFTPCLHKLQRGFLKCTKIASNVIFEGMDNISGDDRNALLVILALLLTAAYQTSVSPPGGVWQDNDPSSSSDQYNMTSANQTSVSPPDGRHNDSSSASDKYHKVGKSVMSQSKFIMFYLLTSAVFMVAIFLTLNLLKPYPRGFKTALQLLLIILAICFLESLTIIAPTDVATDVIRVFSFLVFILMMFMCYAYRVSTISVFIIGCWILLTSPMDYDNFNTIVPSILNLISIIILGFWLTHFIYNEELWKAVCLCLPYFIVTALSFGLHSVAIVIGCCCFIKFCQLGIKYYNVRRSR